MKQLYSFVQALFFSMLLLGANSLFAQVTVTSSDSINCTTSCTTLTAHLEGDAPINAGITSDDVYSIPHAIGFTYKFYGIDYTQLVIGANGTLDFTLSDAGMYDPYPITSVLLGNPAKKNNICGPWCDIDIFYSTTAGIGTETYSTDGVAPFRKFVVTWCNCQMYSCGAQRITTQIIIYETTNVAEVHITKHQICPGWYGGAGIVGVQNATGTAATTAPGRDFPSTWTNPPSEAWRFTPDATGATYSCISIPYAPVPYASSSIYWYNAGTGAYMGAGLTLTVCPTTTTTYKAGALGCADTSFGYYTVVPSPVGPTVVPTFTNPTLCGSCDGTITLSGMTPGLSDTVHYNLGGTPQTPVVAIVSGTGTITLTGLCPGTYDNITVKQQACTSPPAGPVTLISPTISITSVTTADPSKCGLCDGSLVLHGLYASHVFTVTYSFNGTPQPPVATASNAAGNITLTGLCAGVYTNIVAFYTDCITPAVGPYTLVDPPIAITGNSQTNATKCGLCDGTLTLTGLYPGHAFTLNYSFNGVAQPPLSVSTTAAGSVTLTGLCAGVYSNIIASYSTTYSTCTTPPVGPFTITEPAPPSINLTSFTNPSECGVCDGTIRIRAVAPYSTDTVFYSLNGVPQTPITTIALADSTILLTGLCAGTYAGMSVKIGNCTANVIGSATLVAPPLAAVFDTLTHFGCQGDSVYFSNSSTSAGALYYIWNFGDGTSDTSKNPMHIYQQGTYTVTLIATNHHCYDSMKKTIVLIHPVIAAFVDTPNIKCQGIPFTFTNSSTATAPAWYNWSFGNGSADTNKNTTYTYQNSGVYTVQLVVHDWVPCYDTTTAVFYVDTISKLKIDLTDSVICGGTYLTAQALFASVGNTALTWDLGDGTIIKSTNPISYAYNTTVATVFTITATAEYRACPTATASRPVTVFPQPVINLGSDTTICIGSESLVLRDPGNSGVGASWLWNTGATGNSITVVAPGVYYATVSINNCHATDSVNVANDCYMDIPNVFTPNGDGVNDYFFPRQYLTKGLTTFKMNIYNRWGQLVFESTSLDGRGWDGRLNDVPQPEGVFIYIIDAIFHDGQKEHHQGNLTLLR